MKIFSIYVFHDTKKVYHIMKWQLFSSLGFVCLFSFEVLMFKYIYICKPKHYCF